MDCKNITPLDDLVATRWKENSGMPLTSSDDGTTVISFLHYSTWSRTPICNLVINFIKTSELSKGVNVVSGHNRKL